MDSDVVNDRAGASGRYQEGLPSEEDVKIHVVLPLLAQLGIERDKVRFETRFEITVGTSFRIPIGRTRSPNVKAYSDLVCYRYDDHPLFVIEVKRPDVKLGERERDQAISYARLLPHVAPYALLTNGHDTRVYDVLTRELVTNLASSGYTVSLPDELRAEAERAFVSFSPENLIMLCQAQHRLHLEDYFGRDAAYSTELFEPRRTVQARLDAFWDSQQQCFALLGASGAGKTAFLCAVVAAERARRPMFYYDARRLIRSMEATLVADFAWLGGRDLTAERVVSRLGDLARQHGTEFVLMLDAINEHREANLLADELNELVRRVAGRPIRLVLACQLTEWDRFASSIWGPSPLARATFDTLPTEAAREVRWPAIPGDEQGAQIAGTWLPPLGDAEVDAAWGRYRDAFAIGDDLVGELREQCRLPFGMRVMAEVCAGGATMPTEWGAEELLRLWLNRRLATLPRERPTQRQLGYLASEMVARDRELLSEAEALECLLAHGSTTPEKDLSALLRSGLLRRLGAAARGGSFTDGVTVDFHHERFLQYVVVMVAERWPERAPRERAQMLVAALEKGGRLARAAASFYLLAVDRGNGPTATELLRDTPNAFLQAALNGVLLSPGRGGPDAWFAAELASYCAIRDELMPGVAAQLSPYVPAGGPIGLVVRRYPHASGVAWWAVRPRTTDMDPELLLEEAGPDEPVLPEQLPFYPRWLRELGAHDVHFADLSHETRRLPQYEALRYALVQVRRLVGQDRPGLNESDTPLLARDRVARRFRKAAELLGPVEMAEPLRREEVVEHQRCNDWLTRLAHHRFKQACLGEVAALRAVGGVYAYRPDDYTWAEGEAWRRLTAGESLPPHRVSGTPDWLIEFEDALRTLTSRGEVFGPQAALPAPDRTVSGTFGGLSQAACIAYLRDFLPAMLREYRALVLHNFPRLLDALPTWQHGPVYLQAEVGPASDGVSTGWGRFEMVVGGQLLVLYGTTVGLKWAVAPAGRDEVHVVPAQPPSAPERPGADRPARFIDTPHGLLTARKASYSGIEHFVGEGSLVRAVYTLLDDDFQELFGRELWSWHH